MQQLNLKPPDPPACSSVETGRARGTSWKPAVPSVLNPTKHNASNRLEMAKLDLQPENPLTARVFTNRIFSELFGRGIVETLGDFG